jgi:hypothetical protein
VAALAASFQWHHWSAISSWDRYEKYVFAHAERGSSCGLYTAALKIQINMDLTGRRTGDPAASLPGALKSAEREVVVEIYVVVLSFIEVEAAETLV